jgi:hypothetical protein
MRRPLAIALSLALAGLLTIALWSRGDDIGPPPISPLHAAPPSSCQRDAPMLVAPIFHGVGLPSADTWIVQKPDPDDLAKKLASRLDALQPRDGSRAVALGYTLTIPILSLFEPSIDGHWRFAQAALEGYLTLIERVNRPVVVYLLSDHFSPDSALTRSLSNDPRNLMAKPDGTPPKSRYFGSTIFPFTLSTDEQIPVNQLRFEGVRQVARALHSMKHRHPDLVQAVTLGGEFHHLFDGLQENTGRFTDIAYTDHSALAQQEFRTWLQTRYADIGAMNSELGTPFSRWDEVRPPTGDIRSDQLQGFWQHMDANAPGTLPVFGWIDVEAGIDAVRVDVNGRPAGWAQLGLNRLDVYQARSDIRNPNTGFRFDLPVHGLAPGIHQLRLVAVLRDGSERLLANRQIARMAPDQSLPTQPEAPLLERLQRTLRHEPALQTLAADKFWLDGPREMQDVYVNPFAAVWQRFREHQVRDHIRKLSEIVASEGLDSERVFSHQLLPHLNGGWNDTLFAAGRSFENAPFQPGITLYGGLTIGVQALASTLGRPYGVPEMNPLLGKDPSEPEQALEFALAHCARFVSPMFMNLSDSALTNQDTQSIFLIDPNSPHAHGRNFHAAIERFVRR